MKKVICSLLTLMLVGCLMVGCTNQTEEPVQESATAETSEEKQEITEAEVSEKEEAPVLGRDVSEEEWLPLVKDGEDVTLTIGIQQHATVENYDTNAYTLYLEEKTGVNLEFVYFTGDQDATTQLTLMAAGGEELPDIIWGFNNMDRNMMFEFGRDGYFLDLKDYFENLGHYYWMNYEKMDVQEQERVWSLGTDPESGGFYGMPHHSACAVADNGQCMMSINQKWLDALGMEAPTNIDELYDVLVAFRDKDPNGNGKKDEVPALGRMNSWRGDVSDYIVNAFVYYDQQYILNATAGNIWAPFITDEYREAMKYLNKLVEEGLVAELSFTAASNAELKPLITPVDGNPLTGIFAGHPLLVCENGNSGLYDYVGLAPLDAATDKGGYLVWKPQTLLFCSYITSDCENPELAFKFLDFFYADDTVAVSRNGVEGQDWVRSEGINPFGDEVMIKALNGTAFTEGNVTWHQNGHMISTPLNYLTISDDSDAWGAQNNWLQGDIYHSLLEGERPEEVVWDILYNVEETEIISEIEALLKGYLSESRAKFATGVWDPNDDAVWDNYLKELEEIGLTKYMEISQTAYDRMK